MKNKAAKIQAGAGFNNHYLVYTKDRDFVDGNMEVEYTEGPEINRLRIERFGQLQLLLSKSEAKTIYRVLKKAFDPGEKQRNMKHKA